MDVDDNSILKGKNTQEIYDNMREVSRSDALKYIPMTKWADECNINT